MREYIQAKQGGDISPVWTKPSDWIDISNCADNEILLLVGEGAGIGIRVMLGSRNCVNISSNTFTLVAHGYNNNDIIQFSHLYRVTGINEFTNYYVVQKTTDTFKISLTSGGSAIAISPSPPNYSATVIGIGTYSIDWGDGTIDTGRTSGTLYQHQYTTGTGGTSTTEGTCWKIRIYGASGNITGFKPCQAITYCNKAGNVMPIWMANIGARYITSFQQMFYDQNTLNGSYSSYNRQLKSIKVSSWGTALVAWQAFYGCNELEELVLPNTWGNLLEISSLIQGCQMLQNFQLPSSWGSVTNISYLFSNSIKSVKLPDNWGSITNASSLFTQNSMIRFVKLPDNWGSITNLSSFFYGCTSLETFTLPSSWGSVTDTGSFFYNCNKLKYIIIPSSWGSVTVANQFFYGCYNLQSVTLPSSWGSVANISAMFQYCASLKVITLPLLWGSVTYCNAMFNQCTSLVEITLPNAFSLVMSGVTIQSMFSQNTSLRRVNNLQYLGTINSSCTFQYLFQDSMAFDQAIVLGAKMHQCDISGSTTGSLLRINSIRLTNSSSPFGLSAPQINISYTSLDATALNLLFGDLPTLTGKTINITGCTGAASCTRSIATAKGWTVTG